jgi:hypothetical protein
VIRSGRQPAMPRGVRESCGCRAATCGLAWRIWRPTVGMPSFAEGCWEAGRSRDARGGGYDGAGSKACLRSLPAVCLRTRAVVHFDALLSPTTTPAETALVSVTGCGPREMRGSSGCLMISVETLSTIAVSGSKDLRRSLEREPGISWVADEGEMECPPVASTHCFFNTGRLPGPAVEMASGAGCELKRRVREGKYLTGPCSYRVMQS